MRLIRNNIERVTESASEAERLKAAGFVPVSYQETKEAPEEPKKPARRASKRKAAVHD